MAKMRMPDTDKKAAEKPRKHKNVKKPKKPFKEMTGDEYQAWQSQHGLF